jgi:hypothetical protein
MLIKAGNQKCLQEFESGGTVLSGVLDPLELTVCSMRIGDDQDLPPLSLHPTETQLGLPILQVTLL